MKQILVTASANSKDLGIFAHIFVSSGLWLLNSQSAANRTCKIGHTKAQYHLNDSPVFLSLEAKGSMKRSDFHFHRSFCFIKYIYLSCEKLAAARKNSGIFMLTNRISTKSVTTTHLYLGRSFATLARSIECSREQCKGNQTSRKCGYTEYNWGGWQWGAVLYTGDLQSNQFKYNLDIYHRT